MERVITKERKLIFKVIKNRYSKGNKKFIFNHVKEGTTIITDSWPSYKWIDKSKTLKHKAVNHSINWVDKESGACTNTIEGNWTSVKRLIPNSMRRKGLIEPYLFEATWRRKHCKDLWFGLIEALRVRLE